MPATLVLATHDSFAISQEVLAAFEAANNVQVQVLMLGDAAGMITPLCGNGMSMALHSSKIAFRAMQGFLEQQLSRPQMEAHYQHRWQQQFARRLQTGRLIQRFFGQPAITNHFVSAFRNFPILARPLIRMTHGEAF